MTKRKTVGWLVFSALMVVIVLQLPRIVGNAFYVAGAKLHSSGKYQAAATAFQGTVFFNPGLARGHVELGSAYFALKNYRKAEQAYLKARSIQDESCASCGLGMTYYALGRQDDAEKAFRRSISLDSKDACPHYESGKMYYDLGNYQEAIAAFKRAAAIKSTFATHVYLGHAYVYAREFESGIDAYKEAINLNPRNAAAHRHLGIAYSYLNRHEEAAAEYKQAINLDPDDDRAHYSLALTYVALHNKPAALEQYEILRKLNPDSAAELATESAFQQEREKGKEKLYFIPLGSFAKGPLNKLVTYYKQKPGIDAIPTASLRLELFVVDKRRQQVIAEQAIELMKRRYPKLAEDPNAILIGLTDEDMYIREKTWQYAFSYRTQGRFAVVSTARMNPANLGEPANDDLFESRVRKMILKNIGILYYRLPANRDPKSVLYNEVSGLQELDNMSEDF